MFLIGCRHRQERLSQPQPAPGSEGPDGVPDPCVLIPQDGALPLPGKHSTGGPGSHQGWLVSWGSPEAQRGELWAALVAPGDLELRGGSPVVGARNPQDATRAAHWGRQTALEVPGLHEGGSRLSAHLRGSCV